MAGKKPHVSETRHTNYRRSETLAWVGMSLEDEERPEKERSELTLTPPTLAQIGIVWSLEYIANLIEHFLPGQLHTRDHATEV